MTRTRKQRLGDALFIGLIAVIICVACWLTALWAFNHDARAADRKCHSLGAEKVPAGHRYLCVTPDGRIVGRA